MNVAVLARDLSHEADPRHYITRLEILDQSANLLKARLSISCIFGPPATLRSSIWSRPVLEDVGPIMDALREALNPWLGTPKWKQSEGRVRLVHRMQAEDGLPRKLKVEINSWEHFTVFRMETLPMEVKSRWFSGGASIRTCQLDELMGTKMRALYQRKKGRDLFDLWIANKAVGINPDRLVDSFRHYMEHENH